MAPIRRNLSPMQRRAEASRDVGIEADPGELIPLRDESPDYSQSARRVESFADAP